MASTIISIKPEALEAHLSTLRDYVDELKDLANEVLSLTFGNTGGNDSAGPCSGKANDLNKAIHDIALGTAAVIENSVAHLDNIKADISAADETNGGS